MTFGRQRPSASSRPASNLTEASGRVFRGEALQVVLGVAEGLSDHGEPAERVADLQLLGHAHAAVELDRLLADVPAGVRHLDLGRGDRAGALPG